MKITSLNNDLVKETAKLLQNKYRKESNLFLIEGEKGTGRKELAIWLAKAILCKEENRPCGNCSVCRKIESGNHPDVEVFGGEGE